MLPNRYGIAGKFHPVATWYRTLGTPFGRLTLLTRG